LQAGVLLEEEGSLYQGASDLTSSSFSTHGTH
jgi:hypothetical protein